MAQQLLKCANLSYAYPTCRTQPLGSRVITSVMPEDSMLLEIKSAICNLKKDVCNLASKFQNLDCYVNSTANMPSKLIGVQHNKLASKPTLKQPLAILKI